MRESANSNTARDFGDENMIAGMLIGMPFQSSKALTIGGAAMIQGVWTVTKVGRASLLLACRGRWSRWELGDSRSRSRSRPTDPGETKARRACRAAYTLSRRSEPVDATAIFLASLVFLTTILGIAALIGLFLSTWYILAPIILLAAALIFMNSGLLVYAIATAVLLAAVLWGEYRVLRG
jgi:hypothetical protein